MTRPDAFLLGSARGAVRWCRARPMAVDVVFAALIGALAFAEVASARELGDREADALAYWLTAVGAVALIWRRIAPLTVLVTVTIVLGTFWLLGYGSFQSVLGLPAVYSAVVHGENRRRTWLTVGACTLAMLGAAAVSILDEPDGFSMSNAISMVAYLAGAAAVGAVVRNRKQIFVDMEDRADRAEADQLAEAQRAVAHERIRIAREMHDVVAHGMSVITVQAAAAQAIVRSDPDAAAESLAQIEATGRESLNEMRRMLGVLRSGDDETSTFEPQPGLGEIRGLVNRCIDAGVPTELVVTGSERELPAGVGLAAYRLVQEALTNVFKHAGTSAQADVRLDYTDDALQIEVVDDGRGAVTSLSSTGGGNGLIGMRERVEVYGGEFSAQPSPGGGYRVRAALPIETAVGRPSISDADAQPTRSST
jgi:signal transduction histidine kinase